MTIETEKQKNNTIELAFGDVREKKIITANDFVSHMVEHIAWRLGLKINLEWNGSDWRGLGVELGKKIRKSGPPRKNEAAALGMIDDGSAEVSVALDKKGTAFSANQSVDLNWFLNARCEQTDSGAPLRALMEGLGEGMGAKIDVKVGNLEDMHHTWEGIYRAVGIALNKIFTPEEEKAKTLLTMRADTEVARNCTAGEVSVLQRGINKVEVRRGTAETGVTVGVDFSGEEPNRCELEVNDSIKNAVGNIEKLFADFARAMGVTLQINFKSIKLSSSHVVMEDIGLVLGKALLEVLKLRMEKYGLNAAGSNVQTPTDMRKNARVGVSVEGRKFWRFVPADGNFADFKKKFLLGRDVLKDKKGGLRSEDLDDFIDGLSGGLCASIMVQIKDYSDVDKTWQEIFVALGEALKEAFEPNPYRQGVPPGVKATLA